MHYPTVMPLAMTIAVAEECREMMTLLLERMGIDMSAFCTAIAAALPVSGQHMHNTIPISEELDSILERSVLLSREKGSSSVEPSTVFETIVTEPGEVRDLLLSLGATEAKIITAFSNSQVWEYSIPKNLRTYAIDLTEAAKNEKIEPVIGRDSEIRRLMQILLRKTKNNPVLVGAAGTGKTAIAEGLALQIAKGDVPDGIKSIRLFSLDIPALIAGAGVQGEFEDRLKKVMKDVNEHPEIVLFIDEIHLLIGSGGGRGGMDAANILKPALSRGEIRVIGATTTEEYTQYIESDKAFERRFQKIMVEEPDEESAIQILMGIRGRFEVFHAIQISDEAIRASVHLSKRYIGERYLPDKAIDLLDEASSQLKMEDKNGRKRILKEEHIHNVVTAWTGIPIPGIQEDEAQMLSTMEKDLARTIVGQQEAVNAITRVIRRNKIGLGDAGRPIGSFLFLGPTGVGKTALAKELANFLFNSPDMMIRIDMSEYQQEHTVSRLFGAPPGYVGYGQGGQLTEAVRHKPYSVILLDEIEKAHPRIFETLLQVLDDGRMTDGQGRTVNFKNTIIIMTSNLREEQLKTRMSPEFLNRIDAAIVFNSLGSGEIHRICYQQMIALQEQMTTNGICLEYDENVINLLCEKGYCREYGARAIKRIINHNIIDGLASALVENTVSKESPIVVSISESGDFVFHNAMEQIK